MDFKEYLDNSVQQIDQQLEVILSDFLNETKKTNIKLLPLALGFINACKGGKRIRGVLVKLGYELVMSSWLDQDQDSGVAGAPQNDIVKVGAALEILHTAILIHDDIIDQSPTRRNQPSLYMALGGDHYGVSQAITLGDIGLYLPVKIITQSNFLGDLKLKALDHLSQTIINTGWGEALDVEKDSSILMQSLKTAQYTISGPLITGAILGGAGEKLTGVLGEFGHNAGIAFQIQDDILDKEALDSEKSKALEYASKAKQMIPKITPDKKLAGLLEEMVEFLVNREK